MFRSAALSLVLVAGAVLRADSVSVPGRLHVARSSHQATLLADGRVLVTGGSDDRGRAIGAAEIYNPITGEWSIVAGNLVSRFSHAAALLQDGRVLVVGGVATTSPCQPVASAELYDPSTDRWSLTADVVFPTGRGGVAVTLADGRVLVRGGTNHRSYGALVASARNSQGHILIAYRDGDPPVSILEWEVSNDFRAAVPRRRSTPYIKAIGDGQQQFHSIRIDQHDNIWGVSSTAKEIVELSPEGAMLLRFSDARLDAPSDIAWDAKGNLFVADNGSLPKVVKFDRRGRFLAETPGISRPLKSSHSLAIDAAGNVYVVDGESSRIEVFDNGLTHRTFYYGMGEPWALCIARGPREYLYSASNPDRRDGRRDHTSGEIYRLDLDGTILDRARGEAAARVCSQSCTTSIAACRTSCSASASPTSFRRSRSSSGRPTYRDAGRLMPQAAETLPCRPRQRAR